MFLEYNDANELLVIGNLPETYKPTLDSGSTKDLYLNAIFEVTNSSVIKMNSFPSEVLASKKYVDDKVALVSNDLTVLQRQVTQHLAKDNVNAHAIANINGLQTALNGKQAALPIENRRKITYGTANPTGGVDGDIYFQYG